MILQRVPGSPIPLPAGNFTFAFPQGVVDAAGVYHLFWAEFRPGTAGGRAWPPDPTTLWYARWAAGVWSAPEKIAEGTALHWNGEQGHVVLDSTGAVHVVVDGFFQPAGFAIAHLTRRDASWARQTLPIQTLYASMAATRAGLVLAYVAADSAGGSATTLMVRHATDGSGNSWNRPVRVARADHGGLGSPILLPRPSGGEDVLWMESSSPLALSQRLHRISISDRDASSSRDESIDTHALPGSLRAAATTCGQLAVVEVMESREGRLGMSLQAIRFDGFGVPTWQRIYPQFELTASGAVTPLADSVALVFAALRDSTHSPTVEVGRTSGCQRR